MHAPPSAYAQWQAWKPPLRQGCRSTLNADRCLSFIYKTGGWCGARSIYHFLAPIRFHAPCLRLNANAGIWKAFWRTGHRDIVTPCNGLYSILKEISRAPADIPIRVSMTFTDDSAFSHKPSQRFNVACHFLLFRALWGHDVIPIAAFLFYYCFNDGRTSWWYSLPRSLWWTRLCRPFLAARASAPADVIQYLMYGDSGYGLKWEFLHPAMLTSFCANNLFERS